MKANLDSMTWKAGADVVMPNLSPVERRDKYALYAFGED